jgi:hypothetical protein
LVKTLGADANKADSSGATPLIVAAQNGHLEIVQCLLEDLGANVNLAMDGGSTPMMVAASDGHLAVVRCLGVSINHANQNGLTALTMAAPNGHLVVVKCLVAELGANIDQTTHDGCAALMMASYWKHDKVIRWLTRHGADVQATAVGGTAVDASRAGGAPTAQTEHVRPKRTAPIPAAAVRGSRNPQAASRRDTVGSRASWPTGRRTRPPARRRNRRRALICRGKWRLKLTSQVP